MATLVWSPKLENGILAGSAGLVILLILLAIATPNLLRSRIAADKVRQVAREKQHHKLISSFALPEVTTLSASGSEAVSDSVDRRLVQTNSLDLVVKDAAQMVDRIRQLAENSGGFLMSSQVSGSESNSAGSLTIRVPVSHSEEVREQIRKLGLRIDSDRIEAQDVTRQYVDQESRLRNLRAIEAQYLAILKRARTVKDTLEVSEKLNDVRGQIEQQQAEFNALSKQIETVEIAVNLRTEAETQVFGLNWRPLYHLKIALRDGLEGIAGYVASMATILFYIPTILLWLGTILAAAALGWRILRWTSRILFVTSALPPVKTQ